MSEPSNKPSYRRRRFVLDDRSQSTTLIYHLVLLAGICAVSAVVLFVLSRAGVLGAQALADSFPILLAAQVGCFVLAGLICVPLVMRLTHRYVGPALVMRRALKGMRLGDYGCRLTLRETDFLKSLAEEINAHRSDLARREVRRERTLQRVLQLLDEGDVDAARTCLVEAAREDSTPTRRSA